LLIGGVKTPGNDPVASDAVPESILQLKPSRLTQYRLENQKLFLGQNSYGDESVTYEWYNVQGAVLLYLSQSVSVLCLAVPIVSSSPKGV
jgi:hypothetical protein